MSQKATKSKILCCGWAHIWAWKYIFFCQMLLHTTYNTLLQIHDQIHSNYVVCIIMLPVFSTNSYFGFAFIVIWQNAKTNWLWASSLIITEECNMLYFTSTTSLVALLVATQHLVTSEKQKQVLFTPDVPYCKWLWENTKRSWCFLNFSLW